MKKLLILLAELLFSLSIIAQKSDYEMYRESQDSSKSKDTVTVYTSNVTHKDAIDTQNIIKDTIVYKTIVEDYNYPQYVFFSYWYNPYFGWYSPYFYPRYAWYYTPYYRPYGWYGYNNYSRYNNVQYPVHNRSYIPIYSKPNTSVRRVYNESRYVRKNYSTPRNIKTYSAPRSQGFRGSISHSSGRR